MSFRRSVADYFFVALFSIGALMAPWIDAGIPHWKAAVHIGLGLLSAFALGMLVEENSRR